MEIAYKNINICINEKPKATKETFLGRFTFDKPYGNNRWNVFKNFLNGNHDFETWINFRGYYFKIELPATRIDGWWVDYYKLPCRYKKVSEGKTHMRIMVKFTIDLYVVEEV